MCNKILLQVAAIVSMSPTLSMPTKYKICVYMYDNYVIFSISTCKIIILTSKVIMFQCNLSMNVCMQNLKKIL